MAFASLIVAALLAALLPGAHAAQAAPVYEIEGAWVNPPASISRGNPVVAEWRVNVNDDLAAPTNAPVDNVVVTFQLDNAFFDEIPDLCLTTGVDPPSSLSPDGTALTCNLGTVNMGTALVVQTPVVANGITGEEITHSGTSPGGETIDLDPIPIVNPFVMDMQWAGTTEYEKWDDPTNPTYVDVDLEWSVRMGNGSDPGPDSVTYRLNVATQDGSPIQVGFHPPNVGQEENWNVPGCTEHELAAATGHPYSTVPGNPRHTNFVDSCTLTQVGPNAFDLTLTGINYDLLNVPELDSFGNPLPPNWDYVASGMVWFRVLTDQSGSISLTMAPETYTAPTGQPYPDPAGNNTSNKAYTLPGGFSAAWYRPYTSSGGTAWDDTYRLPAGTTAMQYVSVVFGADQVPPDTTYGDCLVFDTAYVEYAAPAPDAPYPQIRGLIAGGGIGNGAPLDNPPALQYYTGAVGNPNAFDCFTGGGWSTTAPADLSTVTALRIVHPHSLYAAEGIDGIQLVAYPRIRDDAPIGQDVWMFGSARRNGVTYGPGQPWDSNVVTPTPDYRYPATNGRRDVLAVVLATPYIEKAAARSTITPGVPADFTLTYSANGTGVVPPTVDDYQIVDTLPPGMTYEPGSADPEPVVSMSGGRQVLTWTIDGVTTNVEHTLSYQAVAAANIAPGTQLTNTAVSTLAGESSAPAEETVTTTTNGSTFILKTSDVEYIPNPDGSGDGTGSWTVAIQSVDPLPQAFTDTIDILPYIGDQRGTAYHGTYVLDSIVAPAGAGIYYTTAARDTLSDDPSDPANGAPNAPSAMWSTTAPADLSTVTAVRVIGGELEPGATFEFQVVIDIDGALGQDVYVNRAQAIAGHTGLVMRTSAPLIVANYYAYVINKEVQDKNGVWHDADVETDAQSFELGDNMNYRIVVTNTGQGTLTNVAVTDDKYPGGSFTIPSLAPGATATHEFTITAAAEHLGTYVNTACATVLDTPVDAEAPPAVQCDPVIVHVATTTFDKQLIGRTANGDGTYTITYDIVVSRTGDGAGYNLTDTLRYGASATVVSTTVANTAPGSIATNPGWNGIADTAVATAVPIANGESHTYRATVIASVDEPGTTGAMSDCTLDAGESGTGFYNESRLVTGQTTFDDNACPPYPGPVIAKSIVSGPTEVGPGRYTISYEITVTNNGVDPTTYNLDDSLRYGSGVLVDSATVTNTAPGSVPTNPRWNGTKDQRIATGAALGGLEVQRYTATVVVNVAPGTSSEALNCSLGAGEGGTGLLNTATLSHNGEVRSADACAEAPPVGPAAAPELPRTGGNVRPILGSASMLMLGGFAVLFFVRRRRALTLG